MCERKVNTEKEPFSIHILTPLSIFKSQEIEVNWLRWVK